MVAYKVRDGFQFPDKAADVIASTIQKLSTRLGRPLTREDVLREAAKPRSPIHRFFEWDDSAAARQYRLLQAGYLLRALDITIAEHGDQPVRSMILVKTPGAPNGYTPTLGAPDEVVRVQLDRAFKDAQVFYERYVAWRHFIEFAPMQSVMTEMEKIFST